jgi:hypothetical protein
MDTSLLATDIHQPLINNKVYHTYLPGTVLAISLFYTTSLLIWAVQKYHRRTQSEKKRREKAKLRQRWEMMNKQEVLSYPDQTYQNSATSNSSVTFIPTSNTSATIKQESMISYDVGQYSKRKLDLLWQWSMSMGYCQYQYGRDIDQLIQVLQTKHKKEL